MYPSKVVGRFDFQNDNVFFPLCGCTKNLKWKMLMDVFICNSPCKITNNNKLLFALVTVQRCLYLHPNYCVHSFDCFVLPWQASAFIQFRLSTFCAKINWCQPDYIRSSYGIALNGRRHRAALKRKRCLFMRQFYCGQNTSSYKMYEYTMTAIDSNRILFHAIADVILWELFILFSFSGFWHSGSSTLLSL